MPFKQFIAPEAQKTRAPKRAKKNKDIPIADLEVAKAPAATTPPENGLPTPSKEEVKTMTATDTEEKEEEDALQPGRHIHPDPDERLSSNQLPPVTAKVLAVAGKMTAAPQPATAAAPAAAPAGQSAHDPDTVIVGGTPTGFSPFAEGNVEVSTELAPVNDTMRPLYGMANPADVVPSVRDQIATDLAFEDFSIVAPGFGNGVNNKLFLMQEQREKQLEFREPLCEPRPYDGPTNGVTPPPVEWQNEVSRLDRKREDKQAKRMRSLATTILERSGLSLNLLGDDFGQLAAASARGLPREADSPLEPIVRVPGPMVNQKNLTGLQLNQKEFRRLFDSERYPDRLQPNIAFEGGPTMPRAKAFQMLPFPIGMA